MCRSYASFQGDVNIFFRRGVIFLESVIRQWSVRPLYSIIGPASASDSVPRLKSLLVFPVLHFNFEFTGGLTI